MKKNHVMVDVNWRHWNELVCIFFSLKDPRDSDALAGMSTPRMKILASKHHCPLKGTRCLEKWPIPGLQQRKYKVSLEHSFVLESEEVLKEQGRREKDVKTYLKGLPLTKSGAT